MSYFVAANNFSTNSRVKGELLFSFSVSMIVMARSILTPAIQSLMVVQMKRDKERGAEDIETFGHICEGFGAIFFSIFGGHIITKYE